MPSLVRHIQGMALLVLLCLLLMPSAIAQSESKHLPPKSSATTKTSSTNKPLVVHMLVIASGQYGENLLLPQTAAASCFWRKIPQPPAGQAKLRVFSLLNPNRRTLRQSLQHFSHNIRQADVGIIIYAGPTLSERGLNYLVLHDAQLRTRRQRQRTMLTAGVLRRALQGVRKYGVVLLDGGYKLPALRRLESVRQRIAAGMAPFNSQHKVLAVLATAPGKWRKAEQAGKLHIGLLERLYNSASPPPLQELLADLGHADWRRFRQKKATWPFVLKKPDTEFSYEEEENSPDEIYKNCVKISNFKFLDNKDKKACNRLLSRRDKPQKLIHHYRDFLQQHSYAPCLAEVSKRLKALRAEIAWKKLAKSSDRKSLRAFIEEHGDSKYASQARERLDNLQKKYIKRARRFYAKLREKESRILSPRPTLEKSSLQTAIELWESFLDDYPDVIPESSFAREYIKSYKKRLKELSVYLPIRENKDIVELRNFINMYKDSPYRKLASNLLNDLVKERELRRKREKELFAYAMNNEDLDAIKRYLKDFSDSPRAYIIKKRLHDIEKSLKMKKMEKICKKKFSGKFVKVDGEGDNARCVFEGLTGVKIIPVGAKIYKDWIFFKDKYRCYIRTYPKIINGEANVLDEPYVEISKINNKYSGSIRLHFTRSSIWKDPENVYIIVNGKEYKTSHNGLSIITRKSEKNTVSSRPLKEIAKWDDFFIKGISKNGNNLVIHYSAKGFSKQFAMLAEICGTKAYRWIIEWAALSASSDGSLYWDYGFDEKSKAEMSALRFCRSDGRSCRIVASFYNKCIAVYRALSGGWELAIDRDIDVAKSKAEKACKTNRNGCYISVTFCSDGSNNFSNKNPPSPLTIRMQSKTPYSVSVEFYAVDRGKSWPGSGKVYVIRDWDIHTYRLSCRWGEKVCWGAWVKGDPTQYWGCGLNCRQFCANCCYTCNGATSNILVLRD